MHEPVDLSTFFDAEINRHLETLHKTREALRTPFVSVIQICVEAIENGGTLMFCGNGGSAADAQHLATELTVRYKKDRAPMAALALTTDTSALTAAGNDIGFDSIFSRQVEALCGKKDVLIGLSTSGNSTNVVRALEAAREKGAATIALTGDGGGRMAQIVDELIAIPSQETARIQEMHILFGHMLCGALEEKCP